MKHWLPLLFCLWLISPAAAQNPTEPLLSVELDKSEAAPGETIIMRVKLLGPTWFPKPPEYPSFEIPNVIVRLPEGASYPVSERVGRDTWSGIMREYSLQPMVTGSFRIPPRSINVTWADPETSKPVTRQFDTGEILFAGRIPAGAEGLQPFIAARSLVLEQELDGETRDLQPGDAFKRTVRARIKGAAAVSLPRLVASLEADYLSAYADEPRVAESLQDNEPVGERIETITYVVTSGGSLDVPPIELRWWNLESRQIETARVDGFEISARRSLADILRGLDWRLAAPLVLALIILAIALARLWPQFRAWRQQRRAAYLASEAYAFKLAGSALRQHHFGRAINAIDTWRGRLPRACRARLDDIGSMLLPLGALLYRRERQQPDSGLWSRVSTGLAEARQSCRRHARAEAQTRILPPLNPQSD